MARRRRDISARTVTTRSASSKRSSGQRRSPYVPTGPASTRATRISACRGESWRDHDPLAPETRRHGVAGEVEHELGRGTGLGPSPDGAATRRPAARPRRRPGSAATPALRRGRRAARPGRAPASPRRPRGARRRPRPARRRRCAPAGEQPSRAAGRARTRRRSTSSIEVSRDGHLDQRQLGGVHAPRGTADVDDAERAARPGVAQRSRGTAPAGVRLDEVLGPLDVHALAEHEAGADRVGADVALGPGRAADEAEPVGHPAYAARADPPEHAALDVGDHDQLAGVDHRGERLGQPRHELAERAVGATALQLAASAGAAPRAPTRVRARTAATRRHEAATVVLARQQAEWAPVSTASRVRCSSCSPSTAGPPPSTGRDATSCNPVAGWPRRCVLGHNSLGEGETMTQAPERETSTPTDRGDVGPQARVDAWLARFESALKARDIAAAAAMFATESYWRDLVVVHLEPQDRRGPRRRHRPARRHPRRHRPVRLRDRGAAGRGRRRDHRLDRASRPASGEAAACCASSRRTARTRRGPCSPRCTSSRATRSHAARTGPMGAEHGANKERMTWKEKRQHEAETHRQHHPALRPGRRRRPGRHRARRPAAPARRTRASSSTSTRDPATSGATATSRCACTTRSGTTTCPT